MWHDGAGRPRRAQRVSSRPLDRLARHLNGRNRILAAETRAGIEDLVQRHAIGEVREQHLDWDAGATENASPAHDIRVRGEQRVAHLDVPYRVSASA